MEARIGGRGTCVAIRVLFAIVVQSWFMHNAVSQIANHVVISEVYGGGGNTGAQYKNDYIELYNPTASSVSMTNWSIQYATTSGSFGTKKTIFSGAIGAHGFFLVQEDTGVGGVLDLPTPDAIGSINLSATGGKIALVRDSATISGPADATVVDFVGYGGADAWEGSGPAPTLGATKSAERKAVAHATAASMKFGGSDSLRGNGWDSGNNDSDFVARSGQDPQNSVSILEDTTSGLFTTQSYPVKAGWNMISVPLEVPDFTTTALFPSASSPAFRYDGSYVVDDTLANAVGYWLRFPSDTSIALSGYTRGATTVAVVDGWNLIGTPSSAVDVANIASNPPGIITSSFFGYSGSYIAAGVLEPLNAYWVKVNGPGTLSLSSGSVAAGTVATDDPGSRLNSLTFEDAIGRTQTLRFGARDGASESWRQSELPPPPPSGSFDVRFASQRCTEFYDRNVSLPQHLAIRMQSAVYPVIATWHRDMKREEQCALTAGGRRLLRLSAESGSVTINSSDSQTLGLEVTSVAESPAHYALSPCYPNPFNPTTRFALSVAREEAVHVVIYDLLGRSVARLFDGTVSGGSHTFEWDGRTDAGQEAPGGIYFLRLESPSITKTERMVLMR